MPVVTAAGSAFLLAVLWFDLMFDVQVRGHRSGVLPADIRISIAAYYRRVTTQAHPMSMLVSATMLITLISIIFELTNGSMPRSLAAASLALALLAVGLAGTRTVKNAKRLGTEADTPDEQSRLARLIYKDHCICFVAMAATLAMHIAVGL